jgi:O-methyltransferase
MKDFLRRTLARLAIIDMRISPVARRVRAARLTYLSAGKFARIESALADIRESAVAGSFLECGVALGGSAIVIASHMPPGGEFHGYDVFGMIPAPTERDDDKSRQRYEVIKSGSSAGIWGDRYYGYVDDLYERVKQTFRRFGQVVDGQRVSLHEGRFEDTLAPARPVAFAHIDCDWYDPVRLCLERIFPVLSPGGYIVLDDYNTYGGCRKATDEFLQARTDVEIVSRKPNFAFRKRVG